MSEPLIARARRRCIVAALSIVAFGCSATVSREQLVGTYRVDYGYGVEQLTLKADGTYKQEFAQQGAWFHEINEGHFDLGIGDFWNGQLLNLYDPVIVDVSGQRSDMARDAGRWPMRIRTTWGGQPRFLIDEDIGLEFNRVN
jgi:hypothetical protein